MTIAPVLLMVFNRPDNAREVLNAIRAVRPPKLYVAADGPRASRAEEAAICERTRALATAVDWPCEVKTLFRPHNLGCKVAVSGAISWLFDNEPAGIVLEDDTVPLPSFFAYCSEVLARYADDERVMMVNGSNHVSHRYRSKDSYFFSAYPHVWGWASWRRAWQRYDVAMPDWPQVKARHGLATPLARRAFWRQHWYPIFDAMHEQRIDTWDYQWSYAVYRNNGLAITPRYSLVRNTGFGADATHTTSGAPEYLLRAVHRDLELPLQHPARVTADRWADYLDECEVWGLSPRSRLISAIAGLPGGRGLLAAMQSAKGAAAKGVPGERR